MFPGSLLPVPLKYLLYIVSVKCVRIILAQVSKIPFYKALNHFCYSLMCKATDFPNLFVRLCITDLKSFKVLNLRGSLSVMNWKADCKRH